MITATRTRHHVVPSIFHRGINSDYPERKTIRNGEPNGIHRKGELLSYLPVFPRGKGNIFHGLMIRNIAQAVFIHHCPVTANSLPSHPVEKIEKCVINKVPSCKQHKMSWTILHQKIEQEVCRGLRE